MGFESMTVALIRRSWPIAVAFASVLCADVGHAQRVRLEIRPRIGDTIQMQMDQEIEMSGPHAAGAGRPRSMTGTMYVRTRAIPLRRLASGMQVLAITDSVAITPMGGSKMLENTRRALQGRRVELKVGLDGGIEVLDAGEPAGENTPPLFGPMPPMLPTGAVNVGASWSRDLSIPISTAGGGGARVNATFRLDSLGANGDIAYITMRGTLNRFGASGGAGGSQHSTGTLSGSIQLDRRLGWITNTRLVLLVRTVLTSTDAARSTAQVQMKVTQRLRAMRGS